MSLSKNKKPLNYLMSVLSIIFLVLFIIFLTKNSETITVLLLKSGAWAPLIALILYPLLAITPITTDPITMILAVTYGPFITILVAWMGNNLAALVEYYFGYKIGDAVDFENEKNNLPFGLGKLPIDSVPVLIFGRMIPGYGSKVISILAALYKVPVKRYFWTTAVTNLLGSIMFAYGSFGLVEFLKRFF
mgnify:CR=1 FL=1